MQMSFLSKCMSTDFVAIAVCKYFQNDPAMRIRDMWSTSAMSRIKKLCFNQRLDFVIFNGYQTCPSVLGPPEQTFYF